MPIAAKEIVLLNDEKNKIRSILEIHFYRERGMQGRKSNL